MAITGTSLVIQPPGASSLTPAGQIVTGPGDVQQPAFTATYTFIGDGTITTIPVNWIDGTQTIPFTPKAVLAFAIPPLSGSASTTGVLQAEGSYSAPRVTAITNTSCNVIYSTVVANTSTASVLLVVYR
jgi:hypothetical protein